MIFIYFDKMIMFFYMLCSTWVMSLEWINMLLKILSKIILRNLTWLQMLHLVFASLSGFLTTQTQIKNKNLYH